MTGNGMNSVIVNGTVTCSRGCHKILPKPVTDYGCTAKRTPFDAYVHFIKHNPRGSEPRTFRSSRDCTDLKTLNLQCTQRKLYIRNKTPLRSLDKCTKRWATSVTGWFSQQPWYERRLSETEYRNRSVDVPVGGNSFVSIDITAPTTLANEVKNGTQRASNLLIYLPPGPLLEATAETPPGSDGDDFEDAAQAGDFSLNPNSALNLLQESQAFSPPPTIIQIKYRLARGDNLATASADHRFPTPIHDVSVAFDWILENCNRLHSIVNETDVPDNTTQEPDEAETQIMLSGSHIGGSLALMLALTQPNAIHAVAVHDPIVDWVGLDELATLPQSSITDDSVSSISSAKRRNKTQLELLRFSTQRSANTLINMRTRLFRNPSGFFDPFASPLLFLRAPGRDTPLWRTARPEPEELGEDENALRAIMKMEGGVEVDQAETRELVNERGFGPYDDDWHTADMPADMGREQVQNPAQPPIEQTSRLRQAITDLSQLSLNGSKAEVDSKQSETDLSPSSTSMSYPSQNEIDLSTGSTASEPHIQTLSYVLSTSQSLDPGPGPSTLPRRRKVLRRWPPVGRPEDVELPFVKIYSTPPRSLLNSPDGSDAGSKGADLAHVLHPQAKEMVDVMRRACFWGQEKGFGEDRVELEVLDADRETGEQRQVVDKAIEWLTEKTRIER